MWTRVIASKYGLHGNHWDVVPESRGTFRNPWKFTSSLKDSFLRQVENKVGNGRRFRFWEDHWLGEGPLREEFPELYRVVQYTNQVIANVASDGEGLGI